jgi:Methylamine utilisation protein MauE
VPGTVARDVTADALAPICFLAAGLLVVAGAVKEVRPRATAQALLDAGLPGSTAIARGVGAAEIGVGVWAIVAPAAGGALALGALYLVFAGFLGYVLRAHPDVGSCGCAGPTPVPPSRLHLVLNLVAGLAGVAYALSPPIGAFAWLSSLRWVAVPALLGIALAGWLAVVTVTHAPIAFRAWEPPLHDHDLEPHGHDHSVADQELATAGIQPGHPSLWPGVKEAG